MFEEDFHFYADYVFEINVIFVKQQVEAKKTEVVVMKDSDDEDDEEVNF